MAEIQTNLQALAARWVDAAPGERANLQLYVMELCHALMVPAPGFRGSGYEFELAISAITVEGTESSNFVDCWKAGHFALEGKDDDASRKGKASNDTLLRKAYGQVRNYVHHVSGEVPPPYLMVLDVGKTLVVWDRWSGTYGGFQAGHRIDLATLHERPRDIDLLRDIWVNPTARDRRGRAQAVTVEIAKKLAQLAAALEDRGHSPEEVARFLMRVVFSCFAEDIGLLPAESFRQTITEAGLNGSPKEFQEAVEGMWRMMDVGGRVGPFKFLKFNGHFFKEATALPLTRVELGLLEEAAKADWSDVEPAIFGTLLTRALDPEERHRLGAEYTPRSFIERLVRPTIEEPVLERWTAVQAEVLQLSESGKPKDRVAAEQRLRDFHAWMRGLRVLDPACGSGNFLYVAMHALKRIELEVIRSIERLSRTLEVRFEEIGPWQFLGIEVKPWAREIAELTLWIGFHQFWRQHHDVQPPEPILRDTGTLECRDAVLSWSGTQRLPERDRADTTPRLVHPVTGALVPDPTAKIPYVEHRDPKEPEWPEADFIVGNPPYLGNKRMRDALGDGYVDALRRAYPGVPNSVDFVMYWWYRGARLVASGKTIRAGFITTSSITQIAHRQVVVSAAERGATVVWTAPDHPWAADADAAAVRVALTVLARPTGRAERVEVDDDGVVTRTLRGIRMNADLTVGADVAAAAARPLAANGELSFRGLNVVGRGFILERPEATRLLKEPGYHAIVRPHVNGKDLAGTPRDIFVIDFALRSEEESKAFSLAFEIIRDRVKPERDAKKDAGMRTKWWLHGRARGEMRAALAGLSRYIASPYVTTNRFFTFLDAEVAPDDKVVVIALDDAFVLGVLSSSIHLMWASAAGGLHGVGNDPTYNNTRCFDSFPFPDASSVARMKIAALAEQLDQHRRAGFARDASATVTAQYGVVQKLRERAPLTAKERRIHEAAACGILRDLHDALDAAVADAYGWSPIEPEALILERLVALHDARLEEEHYGTIRWLREAFQKSQGRSGGVVTMALDDEKDDETQEPSREIWPTDVIDQITAIRRLLVAEPQTQESLRSSLVGARRDLLERHLDTLELLGEIERRAGGVYAMSRGGSIAIV